MTNAVRSGPDGMVERINKVAVERLSHPDAGSLVHAYIACLSVPDLCPTITHAGRHLEAPPSVAAQAAAPAG